MMSEGSLNPTRGSRQAILDRIRSKTVPAPEPSGIDEAQLTTFNDPVGQFLEMLAIVGGEAHLADSPGQIADALREIPEFRDAQQIASMVPEVVPGNVDLALIDDPHDLATLDWTVARGEFMVAENGAIWVDGHNLPHRVALFIAQYLAIVVSRQQIVSNLHEAYRRIGRPKPGFGVFVSGPSKTADIEQSLVLGAHGCRKLQVFLLP